MHKLIAITITAALAAILAGCAVAMGVTAWKTLVGGVS